MLFTFEFDESAAEAIAIFLTEQTGKNITLVDVNEIQYLYYTKNTSTDEIIAIAYGGFGKSDPKKSYYGSTLPMNVIFDHSANFSEEMISSALVDLIRNFCRDKNFWAMEYKFEREPEGPLLRALRSNGFVLHATENKYLRVVGSVHLNH